ncbi:MAG: DUF4832 domain-containing protein [Phycisphaerae bacterium]|nr:DUF4832 domain-containing protein [Phycisphaerae bacterium]
MTQRVFSLCFGIMLAGFSSLAAVGEEPCTTVRPADTGDALVNPDMGWTMHFYSNLLSNYGSKLEPSDTLDDFPGLSTVYLRVPWAFLEPEEGQFCWSLLDTPAQRWIARGKRVALRITCSENWLRYATPEWVKNAGANGYDYAFGQGRVPGGSMWDPDFVAPVFLEKLDHFLAAMGRRYDGDPNVAFVDVGTFGLWGEGHTHMSSQVPEADLLAVQKQHIDLHLKHFRKTLLCISDDFAGHDKPGRHHPITDYALSKGVSLRDDSILVQPPPRSWYHAEMAQDFWPTMPVVLEHEHYGSSQARKAWGDGSLLLKAVEDYHASYMAIHWWPRVLLEENRELIERINRRLGYRIQLREMCWPEQVVIGQRFTVESRWANAGVAPCYPGGHVALTLKDAKGGIVTASVDEEFDVRSLPVGSPDSIPERTETLRFTIPSNAAAGEYDLFISLGSRIGTPTIAMPLPAEDGQRRYRIGRIRLVAPAS